MPNKHNADRRRHIPKMRFQVTNWAAYEASLRRLSVKPFFAWRRQRKLCLRERRGSLTLWVSDAAIAAWRAAPRTPPGGQARSSDTAIETVVMVRLVFRQPLRQTEGLLSSLRAILGVDLPVPDHTTISRRAAHRTPVLATALQNGPVTLVIDSTGLKVFGAGEWHRDKHSVRGLQTWRKLHAGQRIQVNGEVGRG
ncbi:hypothetical protein D3877_06160 [Azospirillum cavernae]|uniref:Transposase DDE domain-containing protein n=1 Tax=Azospirillum cavernae TaxID=2320860 RepID=A0A418W2B1_9PROT|nr:transposase [Azospirillum cavernae]RJF84175.1 hypothetical protein D3877_06160 [Azospirillum cavernae]